MRVAVLQGGRSLERGVSLRSGAHVQEVLRRAGHEAPALDTGPELVAQLHEQAPDAVFVALHGSEGEDGTVQGLLELLGLPYTGSGPGACARATDKALAKHLMGEAGIPTPAFRSFAEDSLEALGLAEALPELERTPGYPLVVKPAHGGSALGVKFAADATELPNALVAAFSYDDRVVVERYVRGRDLAVSVLDLEAPAGTPGAPEAIALPIVEAIPREQDFYAYESRYEIGMTTFVCPAELPAETTAHAQELALATYRLLGCHGVARVDLMLDEEHGELTVLETNVVPGLTETSLLPLAAEAAGIDFDALAERILQSAFTR
jgi:D-alanine-D-alanine ligase